MAMSTVTQELDFYHLDALLTPEERALRERVRAFWLAARRGTLGAIEFGALTVPGVVSASAVESIDASVRPARIVTLYVADGSGVSNEALAARVREVLFEWRAAGIFVLVSSSVPSIVPVVLRLRFAANAQAEHVTRTAHHHAVDVNGVLRMRDGFTQLTGSHASEDGNLDEVVEHRARAV